MSELPGASGTNTLPCREYDEGYALSIGADYYVTVHRLASALKAAAARPGYLGPALHGWTLRTDMRIGFCLYPDGHEGECRRIALPREMTAILARAGDTEARG